MATKQREPTRTSEQLTSIEHGSFDTAALQQELAQALEDDRLYKLTDNMKKRAIHTAANYDEFKNLVACADLKPVSQRELRDFSKSARQTNLTYKVKSRKEFGKHLHFEAPPTDLHAQPATAVAFCRNWRRYLKTDTDKQRYLELTTAARLRELFKADLDADLFADIVRVMVATWAIEPLTTDVGHRQCAFALEALEAFAAADRFTLVLDFLDNNQLESLQRLFRLLDEATCHAAMSAVGDSTTCDESVTGVRLAALKTAFKI